MFLELFFTFALSSMSPASDVLSTVSPQPSVTSSASSIYQSTITDIRQSHGKSSGTSSESSTYAPVSSDVTDVKPLPSVTSGSSTDAPISSTATDIQPSPNKPSVTSESSTDAPVSSTATDFQQSRGKSSFEFSRDALAAQNDRKIPCFLIKRQLLEVITLLHCFQCLQFVTGHKALKRFHLNYC